MFTEGTRKPRFEHKGSLPLPTPDISEKKIRAGSLHYKPQHHLNMAELIDVVNERDEVVGQELISICHAQQLLHRGSSILVFQDNSYSSLLLQKRSSLVYLPGRLCLPGGHLNASESYLGGARRELQEELFYQKSLPEMVLETVGKMRKDADQDREFDMLFRTVYAGPFFPDPQEVESFYFCNVSELTEQLKPILSQDFLKCTETTLALLRFYFSTDIFIK